MTIAMCYLSPEGIVMGADSTSSLASSSGYHYFNHNQKLFELGNNGKVGVLTWGLGSLTTYSYRTLIALLADDLITNPASDVLGIANRWISAFWKKYSIDPSVLSYKALESKSGYISGASPAANSRTEEEEIAFQNLARMLVVGFCIGGYVLPSRLADAYEIIFDPALAAPPAAKKLTGICSWWGAPNMINRLILGYDLNLKPAILTSGKWNGTDTELQDLLNQNNLAHPLLPIRDAIDFVYTCIYSTTKAMKFSNFHQVCGGPIEIAVITSDRDFRWVRHKDWDVAIAEGA